MADELIYSRVTSPVRIARSHDLNAHRIRTGSRDDRVDWRDARRTMRECFARSCGRLERGSVCVPRASEVSARTPQGPEELGEHEAAAALTRS
jgi:hypothetical protein